MSRTATMSRPQLSFPAVADEFRDLGSAYFMGRMPSGQNAEIGEDIHGFGADARRMAMAKVQSTRTAQRLYDRTPRFRVTPTGLMSSVPFGINHTRETFPSRLMGGVLTTPEGQQYRRKILDARAEQLRAMESDPPTQAAPPAMKELSEKEAMKDQYALEFKALENEYSAGVVERSQASELSKWVTKFLGILPYYDSNDVGELINYQRRIDDILEGLLQTEGDDAPVRPRGNREQQKEEAVSEFMRRALTIWISVVQRYLGQASDVDTQLTAVVRDQRASGERFGQQAIINLPLKDRIRAVKSILRDIGLARQVKIPPPQPEDVAADGVEEDGGDVDEYGGDEDGGGEVVAEGAEGADVEKPRTQAQITAEVNRRVGDGTAPTAAVAIRQIAELWEDVTNYRPTAASTYKSVRQTLVDRIKTAVIEGRLEPRVEGGQFRQLVKR